MLGGVLPPLQRCSQCILQPQLTGQWSWTLITYHLLLSNLTCVSFILIVLAFHPSITILIKLGFTETFNCLIKCPIPPEDLGSIPGRVIPKTLKWYLIPPCLPHSNIRYISRVKWSNPGKGVAPAPTPRCSSYLKGSLLVGLD